MTQVIQTQAERRTINFYGNLHKIGLLETISRPNNIPYKDTLEIYRMIPEYNQHQYYVIEPVIPSSQLPIYIVLSGTYTSYMAINALALATTNTNYHTLQDFQEILTLIDSVYDDANGRDIILTGYSYGGVKAIYASVEKYNKLLKTVTFNPWVGKWASGFTNEPTQYLNQWYLDQLQELRDNKGFSPVHLKYTKLYNNFVNEEFASKYLQMSSTFNIDGQDKLLSLSWGINFKYPSTTPDDNLPTEATLIESVEHNSQSLYDHNINNFVWDITYAYTEVQNGVSTIIQNKIVQGAMENYVYGNHLIANKKEYTLTNYPAPNKFSYEWISLGEGSTIQLALPKVVDAVNLDLYRWSFTILELPGGAQGHYKISPIISNTALDNQEYIISYYHTTFLSSALTKFYTIQNRNTLEYAMLDDSIITTEYLKQRDPAKISILWVNTGTKNDNIDLCLWAFLPDVSMRRGEINQTNYNPYTDLQLNNNNIQYVIKSGASAIENRYLQLLEVGTYGNGDVGLIFQNSNASIQNTTGILWNIQYNSSNSTYTLTNVKNPNIIVGNDNIPSRLSSYTTGNYVGDGNRVDTWTYNGIVDTQLTLTQVDDKLNTFRIWRDWKTTPGGEFHPQYSLFTTDFSGSHATNEINSSDNYGTQDRVSWFNYTGDNYEEYPIYLWIDFDQFIIRPYDDTIDPILTIADGVYTVPSVDL